MSRRAVAGLVAVLLLALGAFVVGTRRHSSPGQVRAVSSLATCPTALSPELPRLTLDCLGGGPRVAIASAVTGRPALVNVWATWCPPCREEVPYLGAFRAKAAGRVDLVGVLTEDDQANGLRFAAEDAMRYPSVVDPDGTIMRRFPPGPPTTLFIDAGGHLVFRHGGLFHSEAEIERLVFAHFGIRV